MKLWIASHREDETQIYEEENGRFGFDLTFDQSALTPDMAGEDMTRWPSRQTAGSMSACAGF